MTNAQGRTKITSDEYGHVTLRGEDILGDPVERLFTCPTDGGYVYEVCAGGDRRQVCEGLHRTGVTLISPSRAALVDLIRREHRRAARAARRAMEAGR
jgi:hypothetical protein